MTTCTSFRNVVDKRLKDGKKIAEIGEEFCSALKDPAAKVIRAIKNDPAKGEKYLIEEAEVIGFNGVPQLQKAIANREKRQAKTPHNSPKKSKVKKMSLKKLDNEMMHLIKEYHEANPNDWETNLLNYIEEFKKTLSDKKDLNEEDKQ